MSTNEPQVPVFLQPFRDALVGMTASPSSSNEMFGNVQKTMQAGCELLATVIHDGFAAVVVSIHEAGEKIAAANAPAPDPAAAKAARDAEIKAKREELERLERENAEA